MWQKKSAVRLTPHGARIKPRRSHGIIHYTVLNVKTTPRGGNPVDKQEKQIVRTPLPIRIERYEIISPGGRVTDTNTGKSGLEPVRNGHRPPVIKLHLVAFRYTPRYLVGEL